MARTDVTSIIQESRWSGLHETADARQIAPNELADCLNVVVRDGKVTPRPGYVKAHDNPLIRAPELLIGGLRSLNFCKLDTTNSKVYFCRSGTVDKVQTVPFSGGSATDVITSGISNPTDVALDISGARMWISENGSGEISLSSSPIGSAVVTQYSGEADCVGIDVDLTNNQLYWGRTFVGLRKAPITPGSASTILASSSSSGASAPGIIQGVAVDPAGGKVYYSCGGNGLNNGHIGRCNLDGTSPERLVEHGLTGASQGIDLDLTNNKIYWQFTDGTTYKLQRSNLDGTSVEDVVVTTLDNPLGVAVDPSAKLIYFTDNKTNDNRIFRTNITTTNALLVSSFWWRRNFLDVDASAAEFSKDIVLLQTVDTSNTKSHLSVWFPSSNEMYRLAAGYTQGAGTTPSTWVKHNRGTDTSVGAAFSTTSGRMCYAYTGAGIDSGQGGVIMCNGDTTTGANNPFVFNYVLGDTIQEAVISGTPGSGTWTITFDGETTAQIAIAAQYWDVVDALRALASVDGVAVIRTGANPNYTYSIRFTGAWSGKNAPAMTVASNFDQGTVTASVTQVGGTDTDSILYVRPAGLPTPAAPTVATTAATGLDGTYKYRISYYSTIWGIESPLSAESASISSTGANGGVIVTFPATPNTLYFETDTSIQPRYMMIDRVRVYRKRIGDSSGAEIDVWDKYHFVTQVRSDGGNAGVDNFTDTTVKALHPAPITAYPPKNAQYVKIYQDRAIYASGRDRYIWVSELPRTESISTGELGHEYVSDLSFNPVTNFDSNDSAFTSLQEFNGVLLAFTADRVFGIALNPDGSIGSSRAIPGAQGAASHWCIAEATQLQDDPGLLIWVSPRGHVFAFNGAGTNRISKPLRATPDSLIRKYWNDNTYFDPGSNDSWYWATLILDPENNRIIVGTFDTSGNHVQMVYSLEDAAWTKWDISSHGWMIGRDWASGTGQGKDLVLFGGSGSFLYKMVDGKGDSGSAFAWNYKTARFVRQQMTKKKHWYEGEFLWDRRSFGTSATVAVQPTLEDTSLSSSGTLTLNNGDANAVRVSGAGRDVQFTISGTTADDQDHPELVAFGMDVKVGERSAGRIV